MMIHSNVGMPPGGFIFTDPRIGEAKYSDTHTFLDERVKEVIKLRSANPNIYDPVKDSDYLNPVLVRQEIAAANCARLGNNPLYCFDENAPVITKVSANTLCVACNAPLEPRYCPTCAGKRLIGYKCPQCERLYDL